MKILVTGASGFIASQIVTDLIAGGHDVICCVRNTTHAKRIFPQAHNIIACDFLKDTDKSVWVPRLENVDVVINCVGILYHRKKSRVWSIHYDAPKALFDACVDVNIKKVIHISACNVDKVNAEYAKSKKAADDYLMSLPLKAIILRPSLVYGRGSYGGTSLFRGLAGLPFVIPLPDKGTQEFQPIYLPDLSKGVLNLVEKPIEKSQILAAVGPKHVTLKTILTTLRAWLGFSKAIPINTPLWMIRLASWFGNIMPNSAMNSTSYEMMMHNNIASDEDAKAFQDAIDFVPRDFERGVYTEPSTIQDHWHARLFFLKPILEYSLVFIWLFTGICGLFFYPKADSYTLLTIVGVDAALQPYVLYGASSLDILLGLAMLFNFKLKKTGIVQLLVLLAYSIIIAFKLPGLWLDLFAPIAKNIPLIVATIVFLAMEPDR